MFLPNLSRVICVSRLSVRSESYLFCQISNFIPKFPMTSPNLHHKPLFNFYLVSNLVSELKSTIFFYLSCFLFAFKKNKNKRNIISEKVKKEKSEKKTRLKKTDFKKKIKKQNSRPSLPPSRHDNNINIIIFNNNQQNLNSINNLDKNKSF